MLRHALLALPFASLPLLSLVHAGCSKQAAAPSPVVTSPPDAGACTSPDFTGSPLGVHCNQLVDTQGRTVLLHGVNARVAGIFDVTFDDGRLPNEAIPSFTADDAARVRALGFNALRLPIQWSAIEPTEDGGFAGSYLDQIAAVTSFCGAAGILVLLDFHQDAYSKEIGEDGEPLWAISPPPTQLLGGPMGGTLPDGAVSPDLGTRRNSIQVGNAFTTFFDPDAGLPLRARFTAMAAHVAARFASDPAVVGFEIFNEPLTSDESARGLAVETIPAIRAAAPAKLVLWEPSVLRNELDSAEEGDGGSLGAGTAYAPHVYTDAFIAGGDIFTESSLSTSNVNARMEADSWGAPLVITEWGFGPGDPRFADYVRFQQDLQDQVRASAFFWLWKEDSEGSWGLFDFDDAGVPTERAAVVAAISRPRVEAVAGQLTGVALDAAGTSLQIQFVGSASITGVNVVSIGAAVTVPAAQWTATCDGAKVSTGTAGSDPLQMPCSGPGAHTLVVSAN